MNTNNDGRDARPTCSTCCRDARPACWSRPSLAFAAALAIALASACDPNAGDESDGGVDAGNINLADAGPFVPRDAGFDDAGEPVVDAGPINTNVTIASITPPSGPLAGLHRVRIDGTGFTGACALDAQTASGEAAEGQNLGPCDVFFGDVQGDLTNTIVLPNSISVRVPPCAEPGPVDVKVVTALGIGILEGGYTCFSPVRVDAIAPSVGTTDGGDVVTLTGTGFTPEMIVTIGGRQVVDLVIGPLDAANPAQGSTTATLRTPPGVAGRADVIATDAFGRGVLGLGFTYQGALRIDDVAPTVISASGGDVVELTGAGFFDDDEPLAVFIESRSTVRDNLISAARLRILSPTFDAPAPSGALDVRAARGASSFTLEDALVVRPAPGSIGSFAITGAVPVRLDVDGGTSVTVVGEGLATTTNVTVNGALVVDLEIVDDGALTFTAPPAAAPGNAGVATIVVERADASRASIDVAYVVPLEIASIAPAFGPIAGGTSVTIAGRGFTSFSASEPAVTFGGIAANDVVIVDDSTITATTPSGAPGFVDVMITVGDGTRVGATDAQARAVNAFRFDAPLSVLGVRPARGELGGATFVTVTGTGFTRGTGTPTVLFRDTPAFDVVVVSDSTLTARTPPNGAGIVRVTVQLDGAPVGTANQAIVDGAFTYFNAGGNIVGGARGGPIDGAVYVTALDAFYGFPVPGLVAWVGTDGTPVAAGLTNILGTATISGPAVVGPQTVTVAGGCMGTVSFIDIDASELTAFVYPLDCPPQPGGGTGPPPPPPATIRGRVTGFAKEFFDPAALDQSGCETGAPAKCEIAFAEVNTTGRDEFGGTPGAGGDNVVFEEGGEYFIANSRPGRLAVVALAGILDINNDTVRYRQLGVRREVFAQFGVDLIEQDVELTIDLDAEIDVSLPDAPMRFDDNNIGRLPTITRVVPALQLGGEGALVYTQTVEGKRNHALEEMPDVPGEMLTFVAGSYTTDGRNLFTDVGTVNVFDDDTRVTGTSNDLWIIQDGAGNSIVEGLIFVTDRPNGTRFASIIEGVADDPINGPTLQLAETPDFTSTDAPYHIGFAGRPSSEVVQNGVGDLRSGVTIQPILGLPEILSPVENGVLVDRTLRWRQPPGQQPTIHEMFIYERTLASVWQLYIDGARTKVIMPRVPSEQAVLAALPIAQRLCLTVEDDALAAICTGTYGPSATPDDFVGPKDMAQGGMVWQHDAVFVPDLDINNWSLLQIGFRGRRAWTSDDHVFVHGQD